jgi:hypothetical protein
MTYSDNFIDLNVIILRRNECVKQFIPHVKPNIMKLNFTIGIK